MSLQLKQDIKLSQQLVMTPQLQQAIRLLQYSRLELQETIQQSLMENPLLEERVEQENWEQVEDKKPAQEKFEKINVEDSSSLREAEWDDYMGTFSSSAHQFKEKETVDESVSLEAVSATKPSLESHLYWQLYLSEFDTREQEIGEIIISNLGTSGYLEYFPEEIAENHSYSQEEIEKVLNKIQFFDPVGVAARSINECLLRQAENLYLHDPALKKLIGEHLEDLEENNLQQLANKLDISREQLEEYVELIKNLDPRPGSSFGTGETFYIVPDAYIYKYNDEFVILLNEEGLPDLQLNDFYKNEINRAKGKTRDYLQEQFREAVWLMRSIYQRQRTLYKVVESILGFQREFFEHGVNYLRPMVLKDVAEDIEMHESTVSRITTNKYVSTPFGTFELKYFFNSGLGLSSGGQVASESVKSLIKSLVSEEDPNKPLSDNKLVELLNENLQVYIARRTVAKYREAMGIPSSTKRKKMGKMKFQ